MADDSRTPGQRASDAKGPEDERRAGKMAAWTKEFGDNDALNPWSRSRYLESRAYFNPLDINFFVLTWDGRSSSIGPKYPPVTWSTGNRHKDINIGDRVLLVRQTVKPIGLVGCGALTGLPTEVDHLDPEKAASGKMSWVAPIEWDHFDTEPVILKDEVPEPIRSAFPWAAQASGEHIKLLGLFLDQEFRRALGHQLDDEAATAAIEADPALSRTEKQALYKARIGQGRYRSNVQDVERRGCRFTGVSDKRMLTAGHIKPWAACNNDERLDGHNGLMLTPVADRLIDKGYISFQDNGEVLLAEGHIDPADLKRMGMQLPLNVGAFSKRQSVYLEFHRRKVFKQS